MSDGTLELVQGMWTLSGFGVKVTLPRGTSQADAVMFARRWAALLTDAKVALVAEGERTE